jgi:hypothetical protein
MSATVPAPAPPTPLSSPEPRSRRHHLHWTTWVGIAALGWLAFSALTLLIPRIENYQLAYTAQWASVVLGMLLLLSILLAAERPRWPVAVRVGMFAGGVLMVLAAYWTQFPWPLIKPLVALGLMAVAVPIGYWIGERMEKVTNLIPLAIAMSLADIFSLFIQGPTKRIADDLTTHYERVAAVASQAPPAEAAQRIAELRAPLADFIIVHFPIAGHEMTSPMLGIGDFVVLAFLFRAAWVHHMSARLVFASAALSILAALWTAELLRMPVPGLPFIAIGTISVLWLSQPRMRKLDRQERVLSVAVVAIFVGLIVATYLRALI